MILTNHLNLPRSIANAVANDPYSSGAAHISVTGLIGPARKRALELRHRDEIVEDVADRIWALMGQVLHGILERADDEAATEERLFIERHHWVISGQFDRLILEDGTLQDYKSTSTYSVKDGPKPEWIAQLNLYALMIRERKRLPVNRLQTVIILRDWMRSKARHSPDYPQSPAIVLDCPMWPAEQTEAYITERLIAHGLAQHELPECTAEERWARPAAYALWKDGNQRATKIYSDKQAAYIALEEARTKKPKDEFRIETIPEQNVRCHDYCTVAQWCEQHKRLSTNSLGLTK